LNATLTLPGIIGIVLTIGIAVDSNVLIYERIREEVRTGQTPIRAIDAGFTRALATILDSNITTFIAAAVLFFIGTGPVRGFAVTLGIGIITTVFTAFTLTRLMVAWWVGWVRPQKLAISCGQPRASAFLHPNAAYRPRRSQVRFHALPARQLSVLRDPLDRGDLPLLLRRAQFRHRLRRRHDPGSQDQVGRSGRARQDALEPRRTRIGRDPVAGIRHARPRADPHSATAGWRGGAEHGQGEGQDGAGRRSFGRARGGGRPAHLDRDAGDQHHRADGG